MAEYWKSLPRKFCDICKCWFADNKASIDFHERGKRHKENAQKRIQEIQRKGIKEFKKQKKLEDEMEKIEKAALAAYEKDLQNMQKDHKQSNNNYIPSATPKSVENVKSLVDTVQEKKIKKEKKKVSNIVKPEESSPVMPISTKIWYEAITDEGYKYYWNSEESRWEPPEEGFVSIEEQNEANSTTVCEEPEVSEESSSEAKEVNEDSEAKEVSEDSEAEEVNEDSETEVNEDSEAKEVNKKKDSEGKSPAYIGPQPKIDPYGEWVTIEKKKPVEYDLQLPKVSEDVVEIYIPLHKEESSFSFKEKIIGQLSDSGSGDVTFKKRKFPGSFKRNARQRTVDDD